MFLNKFSLVTLLQVMSGMKNCFRKEKVIHLSVYFEHHKRFRVLVSPPQVFINSYFKSYPLIETCSYKHKYYFPTRKTFIAYSITFE